MKYVVVRRLARARLFGMALAAMSAPFVAHAQPVSHSGWPVTYTTQDAWFVEETGVQMCDFFGDGTRTVVASWFTRSYTNQNDYPGAVEVRRSGGSVALRIDYPFINTKPALVDRDGDGTYEIVVGRGRGLSMFDSNGLLLWNLDYVSGDPVLGSLRGVHPAIGDLDGDGKLWIVAATGGFGSPAVLAFDLDGNLRPGFPVFSDHTYAFQKPPTLADLDFDGKLESVVPYELGEIKCYLANGADCIGWPYFSPYDGQFQASSVVAFNGLDGQRYIVAVQSRGVDDPMAIHVIDRFGQPVSPYPLVFPGELHALSYAPFEANGRLWLAIGDYRGTNRLYDLTTGQPAPGWPVNDGTSNTTSTARPAIGQVGQPGPIGILFPGTNFAIAPLVRGYDFSGAALSGYPRYLTTFDSVKSLPLSTLDGLTTTACWTPGNANGSSAEIDCFDVGVPWSRDNVQWGNAGFDVQQTNFFRRLWQIDRPNTCLAVPVTEIASDAGAPFDVTVCPRRADGSHLGPDQEIRLARRPVLGKFVGPIRYDPTTGNYTRTYEPPIQAESADVEFRVLVNDELDDTMPVVHLRGRPKITSWSPGAVARGGAFTTVNLTGVDFTASPSVRATTTSLTVASSKPTSPTTIQAIVRAPSSASIGWSGLQVVANDGRAGNVASVFVYDPGEVTIVGTKPGGGSDAAKLDWFGKASATAIGWTLERSASPDFATSTAIYQGTQRTFTDPTPAAPIWFYRVP